MPSAGVALDGTSAVDGSARGQPAHGEDLLGAADGSALVVQRRRGESEAGRAHGHAGGEADPAPDGLTEEVHAEVDVGEHPLTGRDAHGDTVRRVGQSHEIRGGGAALAVEERVECPDPGARPTGSALRIDAELEALDVAALPR